MAMMALLSLLWGSEWIANMQLSELPHLRVFAVRCVFAGIVLLPFALQKTARLKPVAYGRNIFLGLGLLAIPVLCSALATNISSGLAVVLFAAVPLIATLIEGGSGIAGAPYLIGGLLGIAFLVRNSLSFSSSQGLSLLWVFLSVVCIAVSMVKARQWLPGQNMRGALAVQMLSAAATIGVYSFLREESTGPWTLSQMIIVAALGILWSAIAYLIFYALLGPLRASQVAVMQWLTPVVGVIEAAVWLRHLPEWGKAAGAALAVICAVLMLRMPADASSPSEDDPTPLTLKITLL